jgi:hypothetical protein
MIRLYTSLRGKNKIKKWETDLKKQMIIRLGLNQVLNISAENVRLFFEYMEERERLFNYAFDNLRLEDEALDFCNKSGFKVGQTTTKNRDHHQSSKSMVAAVSAIAEKVCESKGIKVNSNPQGRCAWHDENGLHVTARNLDGSIPSLVNPSIIWEIKEYWGKTSGGSKMSDALYECNLVGFELREYEAVFRHKIHHIVFLDGKIQWGTRKSDLKRFIDIMNQGLIDFLINGKDVEKEWRKVLEQIL